MKQTKEEYRQEQKQLLNEINNLMNKELSKKWKILYGLGGIGTAVLSIILFYPESTPLAAITTLAYVVGVPSLKDEIKKYRYKKLSIKLSKVNKEIEDLQIENKHKEQTLTEEERKKQILFSSYPPLKVTEETRRAVLEHPELHTGCSVRVRMGKFYTDEEYEQRREEILNTPLPGDEPKGFTRKRKR